MHKVPILRNGRVSIGRCAAMLIAVNSEAHRRQMVNARVVIDWSDRRIDLRAMLRLSPAAWLAQPSITLSISSGSMAVLSKSSSNQSCYVIKSDGCQSLIQVPIGGPQGIKDHCTRHENFLLKMILSFHNLL